METERLRRRAHRGFSIEYALLCILFLATMVTALLVTAVAMTKKASAMRDYIDRKEFLDVSAQTFIERVKTGDLKEAEFQEELNENKFGVSFRVNSLELSAIFNREVILYVQFQKTETETKLVAYRYQYL